MKILEDKKLKGLKKEFLVEIAFSEINILKQKKLKEISQKVKIAGFRPGKVPISHVEKLYGKDTVVEVIEEKVSESSRKLLEEKNLRPAVNPEIKLIDEMEKCINDEKDIKFSMNFEALPNIDLIDFKKIKLDKPVASPKKEDIDEALEYLAQQNKNYKARKKGSKAKNEDKLIINYSGSVDGQKFEGGTAEKAELILGSNSFIDTFEKQLIGEEVDNLKIVKVRFPTEYPNKELEGKKAEFEVKILEILSPEESKINDELAKKFGKDTLKDLKIVLEEQIKKDFDQASKMQLKDSLFAELEKNHKFDLPEILVKQEFDQMWRQLETQMDQQNKSFDDLDVKEKDLKKNYKEISEKRISIGLLIAEIGRKNKIELGDNDYNMALQSEVKKYPGQEQQIIDFYKKNPDAIRNLTAPIYEDKVVDFILDNVTLKEKKVSRKDLFGSENVDKDIKQNKNYKARKKGSKAKNEDKLIINYSGSVDGQKFEGGTAEKAELILGSNSFIDTFEKQLIGEEVDNLKIVKVRFPTEYPNKELEGKKAEFEVKILEILSPEESKINDELAKKFGKDTLKDLKIVLEEQIKKDFDQASKMQLKDSLFAELEKNHKFDLPEILVKQEFDQMWRQLETQMDQQNKSFDDLDVKEKDLKKNYKEISEKRISIGLLIAEIGRKNKIELGDNDYNMALQSEVKKYPGQEQQIIDFYKKNPDAIRNLTAPIYEDKVVDFILDNVTLKEKKVSRKDLFGSENVDKDIKQTKPKAKKTKATKKKTKT